MTKTQNFDNHLLPLWNDRNMVTPAFIYDESRIRAKLEILGEVRKLDNCNVLYSLKALSFFELLREIASGVDGFSVSSAFESRLAREVLGRSGSIHLCSPGIRYSDLPDLAENCDYITFNSVTQYQRFQSRLNNLKFGLRINPGLSYVKDERYDPCRKSSKLGIPISQMECIDKFLLKGVSGIHFHNNCESENYQQLVDTVSHIVNGRDKIISQLEWINLGGGYLLESISCMDMLCSLVSRLGSEYNLQVFIEPGKGIVSDAGYLVASVIDLFESDGNIVAVLDTTVNHLPEVFEYQYKPLILQESENGKYVYRLAGASCLSGDLFGDYKFDKPLETGSRIIFANTGAYMLVKANMFNGINLPTIYTLSSDNNLILKKVFNYSHYRERL